MRGSYLWVIFGIYLLHKYEYVFEKLHVVCYCYNKVKWIFLMLISCAYLSILCEGWSCHDSFWNYSFIQFLEKNQCLHEFIQIRGRGSVLQFAAKTKTCFFQKITPSLGCLYDMCIEFVAKIELQIHIFFELLLIR